jgi:hypothetical protein
MTPDPRIEQVAAFGFTERQARFLVMVLLHAGVCLGRQFCVSSGIARGQVMHDFFKILIDRDHATAYPRAHGHTYVYHLHAKPLYAAIGEPNSRFRRPTPLARAVERVMVLDAVLAESELRWLATEREKVSHFSRQTRLQPHEFPHLTFGTPPSTTVRYFPDKLPIGVDPGSWRHVFVYLVTRRVPVDFRSFLHRHAELLRALPEWTIRLLLPRHLAGVVGRYQAAVRDELATPLRSDTFDELRWFFEQRRHAVDRPAVVADARFQRAREVFATPRFRVLYRNWLQYGEPALQATLSPVLSDALERRSGALEWRVLEHDYQHLAALVGSA